MDSGLVKAEVLATVQNFLVSYKGEDVMTNHVRRRPERARKLN